MKRAHRLEVGACEVGDRVADVPSLGRCRQVQVCPLDQAAQLGVLVAEVVQQWRQDGSDGPPPGLLCERTLTAGAYDETVTATSALPRREQLLEAAAALFAERGFHDVGIDDIGSAAGISGPGVYRHFASKQALLESLCDRAMTRMLEGARSISSTSGDPLDSLSALVDLHVSFAVEERALISVWVREMRALSEDVCRSLRRRMRAYEEPWHVVLSQLREDLEPAQVSVLTGATLAMLNGFAFTGTARLTPDELATLLRRMALAALLTREDLSGR